MARRMFPRGHSERGVDMRVEEPTSWCFSLGSSHFWADIVKTQSRLQRTRVVASCREEAGGKARVEASKEWLVGDGFAPDQSVAR